MKRNRKQKVKSIISRKKVPRYNFDSVGSPQSLFFSSFLSSFFHTISFAIAVDALFISA